MDEVVPTPSHPSLDCTKTSREVPTEIAETLRETTNPVTRLQSGRSPEMSPVFPDAVCTADARRITPAAMIRPA